MNPMDQFPQVGTDVPRKQSGNADQIFQGIDLSPEPVTGPLAITAPQAELHGSGFGQAVGDVVEHPFTRSIRLQEGNKQSAVGGTIPAPTGNVVAIIQPVTIPTAPPNAPPELSSTSEPLAIPETFRMGDGIRLQAIRQQQVWADDFNNRNQWIYDIQMYNYQLNAANGDFRTPPPETPIFQTTDATEIAMEMDRIDPPIPGSTPYAELLAQAGSTNYAPATRGTGRTEEYFQMQARLFA